ncbi:MAG: chromate transporter [Bacilli bacterium]|jgi:chromate transporter
MKTLLLLLELFFTFFKIGLFTFGGGYAMIPLMETEIVGRGLMTYTEMINFLAISESTPGPFAINMATFIGYHQVGILGAIVTTTGVVLPSFIILSLIAYKSAKLLENRLIKAGLKGIRPMVIGLIFAAGITLLLKNIIGPKIFSGEINRVNIVLTIDLAVLYFGYWKLKKKTLSPIIFILIAAVFGLIIFL